MPEAGFASQSGFCYADARLEWRACRRGFGARSIIDGAWHIGLNSNSSSSSSGEARKPRILIVTPEITYLPPGMGNLAQATNAKAGGLADVSASLVSALFELGADVHVALPHYRRMFHMDVGRLISNELRVYKNRLTDSRIHLAEDRCFYYRDAVYSNDYEENPLLALAFQR